jgi:hypothetical protein
MTNLSRRIQAAEACVPPGPTTGIDDIRRRLGNASEVVWFVGIFGGYDDYLMAADFVRRDDFAGALAVAARVNEQSAGVAIGAYKSKALEVLEEKQIVCLCELTKRSHPLAEPDVLELQDLIFRTFPCSAALKE